MSKRPHRTIPPENKLARLARTGHLTAALTSTLRRRYRNRSNRGLPRYIGAEQVPLYCPETGKMRYADYVVVDSQTEEIKQDNGKFKRMPPPVHGFEVKVSRSDWLAEHRTGGDKSLAWRSRCHYWWLVAPATDIIRPDEVPPGWGLMVGTTRLRAVVKPERAEPTQPIDANLMLTIARHSARTTTAEQAALIPGRTKNRETACLEEPQ